MVSEPKQLLGQQAIQKIRQSGVNVCSLCGAAKICREREANVQVKALMTSVASTWSERRSDLIATLSGSVEAGYTCDGSMQGQVISVMLSANSVKSKKGTLMLSRSLLVTTFGAFILAGTASAQVAKDGVSALFDSREIPVTIDNFVRAATDIEMGKYLAISGGVNQVFHLREPTPVDDQPTVRMNRDTLYSMAVIDVSEGATLTLPETGDRYISAQIVDQDHYMPEVFVGGGTYTLDLETLDTPYVVMIIRTLVDAADPEDVAAVHAIQDQVTVDAVSAKPFIMPNYDEESFEAVLEAAKELGRFAPDSLRTFGPKETVDPIRYFLGAAIGWGGLPESSAYYLNVEPSLPVGAYKIQVPADVPVEAFWSISLYNAGGRFEKNALDAYNVNSIMGERNDDGSMTVHLGDCEDGRANCLPIMEGWNYTVRMYQPAQDVIDGTWVFPAVERYK